MRRPLPLVVMALALGGCGASVAAADHWRQVTAGQRAGGIPVALLAGVRPIGRGTRFQPPAGNRVLGACRSPLGRRLQAHVEIFAANRVMLLAAGIGTRRPRRLRDGRLTAALCFGALVTLDPTGIVYFRRGSSPTIDQLFALWGQALGSDRIASFSGGRVRVYVDGQRVRSRSPGATRITPGREIVLELGPSVPPHARFSFPDRPAAGIR